MSSIVLNLGLLSTWRAGMLNCEVLAVKVADKWHTWLVWTNHSTQLQPPQRPCHCRESWPLLCECQGPSHGGSYMDKATLYIRIGLSPRVVKKQPSQDILHGDAAECKGVHSLLPNLGHVWEWRTRCIFALDSTRGMSQRGEMRGFGVSWNEPCSNWRTPSWGLGVRTSILLIHFARGHISLCYRTNS